MPQINAFARTNSFTVKDLDLFEDECTDRGYTVILQDDGFVMIEDYEMGFGDCTCFQEFMQEHITSDVHYQWHLSEDGIITGSGEDVIYY